MYIQIKKAQVLPDQYGNYIKITMVGLYDNKGKWIKWIKLTDAIVSELMSGKIQIVEGLISNSEDAKNKS